MVCLQEAEAGRLDLHVSVNEVIPWLELPVPFGPISLHHLLTHTGGLSHRDGGRADRVGRREPWGMPPGFPPGEQFLYSNDGYKLVGLALEQVTGEPSTGCCTEGARTPRDGRDRRRHHPGRADPRRPATCRCSTDRPARLRLPLVPAPGPFGLRRRLHRVLGGRHERVARLLLLAGRVRVASGLRRPDTSAWWTGSSPTPTTVGRPLRLRSLDARGGRPDIRRALGRDGRLHLAHDARPCRRAGCDAVLNGYGVREDIAEFALAAVRAALAGDRLPEVVPARRPRHAGRRRIRRVLRRSGVVDPRRRGRAARPGRQGRRIVLEPEPEKRGIFVVPDPELDRFHLRCVREGDGPVDRGDPRPGGYLGDTFDARRRTSRPVAVYPRALPDQPPLIPGFRIVLRKGRLAVRSRGAERGAGEAGSCTSATGRSASASRMEPRSAHRRRGPRRPG